jgi:uncharacterized protein (DUF305 family)
VGLLVAVAFLGGAVHYAVESRDTPSGAAVDAGFYQDMFRHHEQAVEMALMELRAGTDPTVRSFAQEIVVFQQYENGRMEEQLRIWGREPRADGAMSMGWMGDPVPLSKMPGLATDAQMKALGKAHGAASDAMFLDLMAEHHRAGAEMAQYAVDHGSDPSVRALAERMVRNQGIEINEFAQTAKRLGFAIEIPPWSSRSATSGHSHGT